MQNQMEAMAADGKKFGLAEVRERGRGSREAAAEEAGKEAAQGKV